MGFKAFEEIHGDQSIRLPIRGKEYVIQPPRADVGLALAYKLAAGTLIDAGVELSDEVLAEATAAAEIADDQLPDFARQCLNGPRDGKPVEVYEEMLADGLSYFEVEMATQTAFLAWTMSREYAEIYWAAGGKALAQRRPHPALRQTETPTQQVAASTTPTKESVSGTRRKARAKAARSQKSSQNTTT